MAGPLRLITISREMGSGGSDLAAELGRRLGWRVVDRELISEAAVRLKLPPDEVAAVDEHGCNAWQRATSFVADAFPEMLLPATQPWTEDISTVARVIAALMDQVISEEPAVIVGHASQVQFENRADALHVRVYAPKSYRVAEVRRRLGLSEAEAQDLVERSDRERRNYLFDLYGREWADPLLYHVMVNSAHVPTALGATMIAAIARGETEQ